VQAHQQYIDAFIPDSFLKTYFGWNQFESIWINSNMSSS
jgi:hypothetical protein